MHSLFDYIVLHILLSVLCMSCLFAVYNHSPKGFTERYKSGEVKIDFVVIMMSLLIPYLTLPILILHFHVEIVEFLSGKTWEDKNQ